uniref:Uncharacterized protein n=1 Tax=Plectus sambesii TaxID=2011161 RepID=A0A914VA71_9BILA
EKCISMKDGQTALKHSVWEWLSDAIEMIVDRDPAHLICKDSNPQTKKRNKSSMMLKLFNDKLITMSGRDRVWKVYKSLCLYDQKNERPPTKAILIHFCDKLAGHLTLHYSNIKTDEKPTYGDVSAACLRAYDGGLAVMLMQATWPSKFDRLVKFNSEEQVQIKYGKERA